MAQSTKACGKMTRPAGKVECPMPMETCMKVNGKTTKQMVVAFLSTFLTQDMKETGLMIYSTESAKRLGTTARHATEDNFIVEKRTD